MALELTREEILEVRKQFDTFGFDLGAHHSINDLMDAGGPNEIYCSCGKQLFPDCDMSRVSINQCFNDHRRDVIDNLVMAWHEDKENSAPIWEYLGWSEQDWKDWLEGVGK
jgi:hypothetical protein